ncbi:MAG: efflux RND transporter periplasmic adaptor subunit [Candidatus Moranbacteria bacterium]|nr:efflux RND transporter periplasmic adaptor subunit [Candidatus Moranbacteria bacterium]
MKLSVIKKPYVIIAIVITIAGGVYYYRKTHSTAAQTQYITATAEKGTFTSSVSASGNVIVDQSATVDPTITGTVADLAVSVGEKVTKGQFLFNIVNDQLGVNVAKSTASYQSALSSLESAEASEKQAKEDYHDDDSKINKEKLEAAKASVQAAQKSIAAALSDLNYQYTQAGKRKVTAPITGTVNAVNIKNGDDLSRVSGSSSNALASIIIGDLATLKAQVQVNEVDIPGVSIGQKATLSFDALPGLTITGKVEKMDSLGTITQGVVTYNITLSFDTLDLRIKPEMSVSANIINNVKQNVLLVPSSAVKTEGSNTYVEVLTNNTPVQKTVQIGDSNNTETEIISGLSESDKVITQTINPNTAASTSSSSSGDGFRIPGLGGGGFRRD